MRKVFDVKGVWWEISPAAPAATPAPLISSSSNYSGATPYHKVLLQYYKVLFQSITQYRKAPRQYFSGLQSTTPVFVRTTNYYSSTTRIIRALLPTIPYCRDYASTFPYYNVLLQHYKVRRQNYSVLQSTIPSLFRTSKHYSSTTKYDASKNYPSTFPYYNVLLQFFPVLQSTTPVLFCTTKYYSSTTLYYKPLCTT